MRTLICVNNLTSVASPVYANHIQFATHTVRKFPNDQFDFFSPSRMSIDNARNTAAKLAMGMETDYLMFLDDDVLIPPNTFELLHSANKDIIAGLVFLRGYPFHTMAFKEMPAIEGRVQLGYYDELPKENDKLVELVECAALGFSCCLIRTDVLQALEPPYFVTGPLNTEDVYFCLKTRDLTPRPSIVLHTGVRCGHMLNPEPIEYETKALHTALCEGLIALNPNKPPDNSRNNDYILRNLKTLGQVEVKA